MLSFRLFDLEADPTCRYDYLDVYNGHTRLVQKLGRFCGTFRPGALISTSNTMMLELVSDDGTGGRGFLAAFSAGKPHMDGAPCDRNAETESGVSCYRLFSMRCLLLETRKHGTKKWLIGLNFIFIWLHPLKILFPQRTSSVEDGWPKLRALSRHPTGLILITQQASAAPGTSR